MKNIWKILSWIFIGCGLIVYSIGWIALLTKTVLFGIPTQFWFYDAISVGLFGLFFLIYGVHSQERSR